MGWGHDAVHSFKARDDPTLTRKKPVGPKAWTGNPSTLQLYKSAAVGWAAMPPTRSNQPDVVTAKFR